MMRDTQSDRRLFLTALAALPAGVVAAQPRPQPATAGIRVAAGNGRFNEDEWFYCLEGRYIVEVGDQRFELNAGDSVLGARRVPHAFAFVGDTPGRLLVGFTPAGRMEQFFRDLSARGQYFGTGTEADRRRAEKEYGVVNVGPPLTF